MQLLTLCAESEQSLVCGYNFLIDTCLQLLRLMHCGQFKEIHFWNLATQSNEIWSRGPEIKEGTDYGYCALRFCQLYKTQI